MVIIIKILKRGLGLRTLRSMLLLVMVMGMQLLVEGQTMKSAHEGSCYRSIAPSMLLLRRGSSLRKGFSLHLATTSPSYIKVLFGLVRCKINVFDHQSILPDLRCHEFGNVLYDRRNTCQRLISHYEMT